MSTVTVELTDDVMNMVRQYSERRHMAIDAIVALSVQKFLVQADLVDIQNKLDGTAQKLGFEREDDLFDAIS